MAENNNFHDSFQSSSGRDEEESGSGSREGTRGMREETYKLSYREEVREGRGSVAEDTGTGEVITSLSHFQANGASESRGRATVV